MEMRDFYMRKVRNSGLCCKKRDEYCGGMEEGEKKNNKICVLTF